MKNSPDVSTPPATLPLPDIRVVSIAINLPGPACARRLAEFGASVIKVEPPAERGGDPMRHYAPSYYEELHQGIEVRALDLKASHGRQSLDALLAHADLLLTSQRDGALHRLGLDWPQLSARFPSLCQIAIVGSSGDDEAGHDLTYLAGAGLATPPQLPATLVADLAGAERAVTAAFAVLRLRQQTGRGQRMVVALADAAVAFSGPFRHGLTSAGGMLAGSHPGYNFYRARDGWVALAALEPHFAERVKTASGVSFDKAALAEFFRLNDIKHWTGWAAQHDIPLAVQPLTPPALADSST